MPKKNEPLPSTLLKNIEKIQWERGSGVHLPVCGAARPWICRNFDLPLLVLLPDLRQARDFIADAEALGYEDFCLALDEIPLRESQPLNALKAQRGDVLRQWRDRRNILVTTPGALMAPLSLGGDELAFTCGDEIGRDRLARWLADKGYERVDLVWSAGQFSLRGSIIDVFDPKDSNPLRVEFFDESIESLRIFSPGSQRSLRSLNHGMFRAISTRNRASLSDFFPSDLHVLLFNPKETEAAAENIEWLRSGLESGIEWGEGDWQDWEAISRTLSLFPRIRITDEVQHSQLRLPFRGIPHFKGRRKELEGYCLSLEAERMNIRLISQTQSTLEWAKARGYEAFKGSISEGFVDVAERVAVLGDLELTGLSLTMSSAERTLPTEWVDRLMPGQHVIHENYGLALYVGSEQIESSDGRQEYLILQFAEGRRLMIPVMHFHKISLYASVPGQDITLDNLRGGAWKKTSQKARVQAEEAARYLLSIHAARELASGYAFPKNESMMREFEKTFPFTETVDQLSAIDDIFHDMERPSPMDRLVVGDVGFGKTEVALRAVAKAVFSGRQALLMAPTTLLVQQHFETFRSRFDSQGIRVEMLSRFVPMSRQKKIIADLAEGKVDVLLGTHRLLGSDVVFKDLGLVVIDEEHRFGVMHKEHLKKVRPDVDVLLLSATPIPRSLYLSLTGLRDMSLLQTPPYKRLPVISLVGAWSEHLVKNAVLREKNRGGQVFFVHNRVHSIGGRALMLRRLFPKLSVEVAHGQMSEAELERVMERFSDGDLDILVCTTIVESGLDIPRANTLIIDDAHELGLAQLYQLRGRVGRREEQAFALFLYPTEVQLTQDASERLEAIAELDELGAGYRLSRRDLQIRGGGDLVGFSQHGHLNRIGFQFYCEMLEEEIAKLRGHWKERASVEVGIPCAIPAAYLPQENLRVTLYRRILKLETKEELDSLREEVLDRFGPLPPVLEFLFDTAELRILAPLFGIRTILCGRDETVIQGNPEEGLAGIKHPPGWMRRLDGFIGPGGYQAVSAFLKSLRISNISDTIKDSQ